MKCCSRRQWIAGAIAPLSLLAQSADPQKSDPWVAADLLEAADLAKTVASSTPLPLLYVGFPPLYRSVRIPGAVLAGPCSKDTGMDLLRSELKKIGKNREFVLYCGCCPWENCPNLRPAAKIVKELGYTRVRILKVPTNMHTDWVSKGYPVARGSA